MIKKLKEFKHPQLNNNLQKYMEKIKDQMLTFDGKGVFDTLETKLKEMFNLKYTLTTNSGTSALFSIFYGCGLKPNDEVLVPGYTFLLQPHHYLFLAVNQYWLIVTKMVICVRKI